MRILWSVIGTHDLQLDRLRDVSASGALVATEAVAKIGEEIRFDLLDDEGENISTGLARVVRVEPGRGMGISFLALGIDAALVEHLSASLAAIVSQVWHARTLSAQIDRGGVVTMEWHE